MRRTLAELCDPSRSICYGIVQPGNHVDDGLPILRVKDLSGNRIDCSEVMRVAPSIESKYRRSRVRRGDVLVSLVGSMGQVAIAGPEVEGWNIARAVGLIPVIDQHHAQWVKYSLQSQDAQDFIRDHANTTVQATFNLKDLARLSIPYPPQAIRNEALAILEALDDKIEVNRKTAATLEGMARALYRSWFVDFDPVWAKLEGRAPAHMEPATAALFPDSFGDDGLPEGWCFRTLSEVCTQIKETVKPMGAPDAPFWHFSLPAYDAAATPVLEYGAAIKSNKGFVPNNAILFSRLNPAIPRIWWSRYDHTKGMPAASTEFYVAKARTPQEVSWLYCLLSSAEFLEHAQSRVTGTSNSHQRVTPSALAEIEVADAPEAILNAFGAIAGPFFERTHALKAESQTLAALRDSLLPRLMSGELRVGEAREQIEEVA
ncbi:restriction endonuclease subunit S [Cereibacter sphaeroides]|uniref:restriction endonuclease subunit S n=1 Tax=Cereibacter sphaeroides TaxID=1063 RepID=UPI003990CAA3